MENKFEILCRSLLAGISIALGGAIFVKLGGVIGAVMFAFGLLTVVHFKLPLYTGTAGFIELNKWQEYKKMLLILFGNIVGCFMFATLFEHTSLLETSNIIQNRLDTSYLQCLFNAIGCGLIMTLIVQGGRDKNQLLILFGIPLFILLGFYHSIADAYYMCGVDLSTRLEYLPKYGVIVLGNFIGCNIPRLLYYKLD